MGLFRFKINMLTHRGMRRYPIQDYRHSLPDTKRINQEIRFTIQNHHYCFVSVNFAFEGIDHKFNAFGMTSSHNL